MASTFFEYLAASDAHPSSPQEMNLLGKKWKAIFTTGVIYYLLGFTAVFMRMRDEAEVGFAIATLVLSGGLVQLAIALRLRRRRASLTRYFQALSALLAGAVMYRHPGEDLQGVALALCFYFFMSAATQSSLALSVWPRIGWLWGLASAVSSALLGVSLIFKFPFATLMVPGILLGIQMFISGSTMIALALTVHEVTKLHWLRRRRRRAESQSPTPSF